MPQRLDVIMFIHKSTELSGHTVSVAPLKKKSCIPKDNTDTL
jgi:hypothetical protein